MVDGGVILIGVATATATNRPLPTRDFDRFEVSLLRGGFFVW
jgi:hypothetical protein